MGESKSLTEGFKPGCWVGWYIFGPGELVWVLGLLCYGSGLGFRLNMVHLVY